MPKPSLLGFLSNKTPHFVDFYFFHFMDRNDDLAWIQMLDDLTVDMLELRLFFLTLQ
jgi:hypothetical protein